MKKGKIRNYFPGGNTYKGFYSFYNYVPFKSEKVYIIKGGPGTGKSSFMKKIGQEAREQNYNIELHWCSSDNESIDGVVIPELKTALIDGTAPHIVDPENPGAVEEIINFGNYWNENYLLYQKENIMILNAKIKNNYEKIYRYLYIAKKIHDIWESEYQNTFDKNTANKISEELINEIFPPILSISPGLQRHLFASALTPEGPVNFLDNITSNCDKRYIIKGKPGTGKSTMTKKIANYAFEHGFEILYLHCSFDPESIDSIIIKELNIAIIDGTPPHVINPENKNDKLIDMLSCVDTEKLDIKEIEYNKKIYENIINKSINLLKETKTKHDILEKYYINAMNFQQLETKRKEISDKIFNNFI